MTHDSQPSLFDSGPARAAAGTARVLRHAGDAWKDEALAWIRRFALLCDEFTSDDVHRKMMPGLEPAHTHTLPALFRLAAKQGLIVWTGQMRPSQRPQAHCRLVRVWRGA